MNMYTKVLFSLLATALLPLLTVTYITYRSSKETLVAMSEDALEASASTLARSSVTLVENAAMEVESWAALETLQDVFTGDDIDLRMSNLLFDLQARSDFLEIWCTDTNGRIVAASVMTRTEQQAPDSEALRGALAGHPFIAQVQPYATRDGDVPSVCMAYPLRGAFDDETLIGAIVGFYDWRKVEGRVSFQELNAPQDGMRFFLVDAAQRVIARGAATPPVLTLLQSELPRLPGDGVYRTDPMDSDSGNNSRQLLALKTLASPNFNIAYTGVALAPEHLVLQPVRRLAWFTAAACLAATVGTFLLALVLSRRISRPVTALSRTAREIAGGNLTLAPPAFSRDELGQLAADLDVMRLSLKNQIETLDSSVRERTRQLEATVHQLQEEMRLREAAQEQAAVREQQLRQADKMVSLGILVSGVAHEINNPNGLIALNLGLLTDAWGKALPVLDAYYAENGDFSLGAMNYSELREQMPILLADAASSSDRIKAIVDDLKGFSRKSDERLDEIVDVNRVVRASVNLVSNHLKKATRHLTIEMAPDLPPVRGNERRLEQVVINLLLNACDALETPEAPIRVVTRTDAGQVMVEVIDGGRGIAPADLPHIMDPFFTTRRNAGGTGLGLSVSAGIIEEHRGTLKLESEPGAGATARIVLPAQAPGDSH
jgi:C4-dicarboxylate-specific signal transduction histidine kinase